MDKSDIFKNEIFDLKNKLGRIPTQDEWLKNCKHSRNVLSRSGIAWKTLIDPTNFENPGMLNIGNTELEDWMDLIKNYQRLDNQLEKTENYVKCDYSNVKHPIIMMFSADWHFGSRSCNYEEWSKDFELIKSISPEYLRIALIGDLIDNIYPAFKSADSVFGYLRPELQKKLLGTILNQIKPYLEILTWGNHEIEWDEKRVGYSDLASMFGSLCHYFYGKGHLNFQLGTQRYNMFLTHKMSGKSSLHSFGAGLKGWAQTHSDIIATAHTHDPGYMTDFFGFDEDTGQPKQRHLLQVGTYQTEKNIYSDRYFKPGVSSNPCLVLYPDTYKILHFALLEDAIKWLGLDKTNTTTKKKNTTRRR